MDLSELGLDGLGYFDEDGNALTHDEYIEMLKGGKWQLISDISEVSVSTVWLGMDHGFGDAVPIIFETMVFGTNDPLNDEVMWRYAHKWQAELAHYVITEAYRGVHVNVDGEWVSAFDSLHDNVERIQADPHK
jgi:hypothetical protein